MNSILRKLIGLNWLLVALVVGLSVFGVMAIYSATFMREEVYLTEMWRRQIVWLALGIVVFFVAALIDYRAWLNHVSFDHVSGRIRISRTYPFYRKNNLRCPELAGHWADQFSTGTARGHFDVAPHSLVARQHGELGRILADDWQNLELWRDYSPTVDPHFGSA